MNNTWADHRIDVLWLERRLEELPADATHERVFAIKQLRVTAEEMDASKPDKFAKAMVERLQAAEQNAAARHEFDYILRAMGVPPIKDDPEVLERVNRRKLLRFIKNIDSHGIYKAETFTDLGFPDNFVSKITRRHDDACFWDEDGNISREGIGVSALEFLRHLADQIGVNTGTRYYGRGRQVRELQERTFERPFHTETEEDGCVICRYRIAACLARATRTKTASRDR